MDHIVDAAQGHAQAVPVPDIPDEKAKAGVVKLLAHVELLELVPGIDHDPPRLIALEDGPDVLFSE